MIINPIAELLLNLLHQLSDLLNSFILILTVCLIPKHLNRLKLLSSNRLVYILLCLEKFLPNISAGIFPLHLDDGFFSFLNCLLHQLHSLAFFHQLFKQFS